MKSACIVLVLFCGAAGAAELRNVEVDRVAGRYILTSKVWFDADIESLYGVFLD